MCASLLIATIGCGAAPRIEELDSGHWYHAHVETAAGDEIPFFLELPADCEKHTALIANGEERIAVACRRSGERLVLDFPVYDTQIVAQIGQAGTFSGHWIRGRAEGAVERLPFEANPIPALDAQRRFAPRAAPEASTPPALDVSGVWRIEFAEHGLAKGLFEQAATGVVRGTADVPSEYGDLRFLAGNVHGTELSLSTFDGQHAMLLKAHLEPAGTMRGTFICCNETRDSFVAERSEDFDVVDPLQRVRLTSAATRLDFEPLLNPRYADKAVILEIFGTWCPNCNDLAPLLAELHRDYRDEGLEILGVAYELSVSEEYNRERLEAFQKRHGLAWEVVIADGTPAELFASGPAQLSPIEGVPVTIFLNRDRTIRAVYTGFSGPATGASHRQAVATFRALTSEILERSASTTLPASGDRG